MKKKEIIYKEKYRREKQRRKNQKWMNNKIQKWRKNSGKQKIKEKQGNKK